MRPTPLLVLHGALGAADQMRPVAEALAPVGAVRRFEFPGHGATPLAATAFSVLGFVRALEAWIARGAPDAPDGRDASDERAARAVGADGAASAAAPPIVFGYSMGGYVALALEAERPGTFAGIVTLGTKFAWTPEAAAREAAKCDPAVIRAKVPRFADALAARHASAGGWEANLANTAGLLHDIGARPLLDSAALARVRCPVTLAVGALDDTVGPDEAQAVAALLADARVAVLEGAPHPIEKVPVAALVPVVAALADRAAG